LSDNGVGGNVNLIAGSATSNTGGSIYITSGNSANTVSGNIQLRAVESTVGGSANVELLTFDSYKNSGTIQVASDSSSTSVSGDIVISPQASNHGAGSINLSTKKGGTKSGVLRGKTGTGFSSGSFGVISNSGGNSGVIKISSGESLEDSGEIKIGSGISYGKSGDIELLVGKGSSVSTSSLVGREVFVNSGKSEISYGGSINVKTGRGTTQSGEIQLKTEKGSRQDPQLFQSGHSIVRSGKVLFSAGKALAMGGSIHLISTHALISTGGRVLINSGSSKQHGGDIFILTGSSMDSTGDVEVGSGNALSMSSGDLLLHTGKQSSNSRVRGDIDIFSGNAIKTSGYIAFGSQASTSKFDASAGAGASFSAEGGGVKIVGGSGVGNGGKIFFHTGNANLGQSGNLHVTTTGGTSGSLLYDTKSGYNLMTGNGMESGTILLKGSLSTGIGSNVFLDGGSSTTGTGGSIAISSGIGQYSKNVMLVSKKSDFQSGFVAIRTGKANGIKNEDISLKSSNSVINPGNIIVVGGANQNKESSIIVKSGSGTSTGGTIIAKSGQGLSSGSIHGSTKASVGYSGSIKIESGFAHDSGNVLLASQRMSLATGASKHISGAFILKSGNSELSSGGMISLFADSNSQIDAYTKVHIASKYGFNTGTILLGVGYGSKLSGDISITTTRTAKGSETIFIRSGSTVKEAGSIKITSGQSSMATGGHIHMKSGSGKLFGSFHIKSPGASSNSGKIVFRNEKSASTKSIDMSVGLSIEQANDIVFNSGSSNKGASLNFLGSPVTSGSGGYVTMKSGRSSSNTGSIGIVTSKSLHGSGKIMLSTRKNFEGFKASMDITAGNAQTQSGQIALTIGHSKINAGDVVLYAGGGKSTIFGITTNDGLGFNSGKTQLKSSDSIFSGSINLSSGSSDKLSGKVGVFAGQSLLSKGGPIELKTGNGASGGDISIASSGEDGSQIKAGAGLSGGGIYIKSAASFSASGGKGSLYSSGNINMRTKAGTDTGNINFHSYNYVVSSGNSNGISGDTIIKISKSNTYGGNLYLMSGTSEISTGGFIFAKSGSSKLLNTGSFMLNSQRGKILFATGVSKNMVSGSVRMHSGTGNVVSGVSVQLGTATRTGSNINVFAGEAQRGGMVEIQSGSSFSFGGRVKIGTRQTSTASGNLMLNSRKSFSSSGRVEFRTSTSSLSGDIFVKSADNNSGGSGINILAGFSEINTGGKIIAVSGTAKKSGKLVFKSLNSAVASGQVRANSGISFSGQSGSHKFSSGMSLSNTGKVLFKSGFATNDGGDFLLSAGNSKVDNGGWINIKSGNGLKGGNVGINSRKMKLSSGVSLDKFTGALVLRTGSTTKNSGKVSIFAECLCLIQEKYYLKVGLRQMMEVIFY
jgi:hypothetical protein